MQVKQRLFVLAFKKNRVVAFLFLFQLFFSEYTTAHAQNLESHQWERRVLVIQAPHEDSPILDKQRMEFENSKQEFADRKLILYEVIGSKYRSIDYVLSTQSQWKNVTNLYTKSVPQKPSFIIVLIGLDGGIKLRQYDSILTKEELLNTIDAMPMRVRELQKTKQ